MLVCLILSTKCLKLSSIFWLIYFFLVLKLSDFHYCAFLFLFFKHKFICFTWRLITLQCCRGSAHGHESALGLQGPHPEALPTSLPIPSLRFIPAHQHYSVSAYWSVLLSHLLCWHLLHFPCPLLYSSIIISSFLYLQPLCGILTLFFHACPDRSKYLLFIYLVGPLGLAVSLAFSSCIEWGLHSRFGAWASHSSVFSCCGAQALGCMSSVAVTCRFICPTAWDLSSQTKGWTLLAYIFRKILTNEPAGKNQ